MRTTTIATILIAACLPIAACNTNEVAGKNTTAGAPAPSTTTASAKARATYIQTVTKGMPALAEYDYPVGAVVVRVSRYLTPTQAGEYETAAKKLG
ncbi:hypothetical protein [Streptomyces sp. NPDC005077]|uniref:hypothetical protein n=1 Tax=Streptomyces sp. NPDC005077 TaxID=3154292 RepID=UPI0033A83E57